MPVPGQVHGEQGAAQGQGDGVPGVGVLRPPVHQHELGRPGVGAPEQAGHGAPRLDLDADPAHVGRTGVGQPVLGRVLVEEAEFVVGDHLRHHTSFPYARPAARRAKNAAMPERRLSAVVLAAGEGTRMRSERPKPLHLLCGRPMILHVLDAMAEIDVHRVVVVVGHRAEWVTKTLVQLAPPTMEIEFVEQLTQSGTGDALAVGLTGLPDDDDEVEDVVVLPGDTPLLRPQTLAALVRAHRLEDAGATMLTAVVENPSGYGRVVRGKDGDVVRVVEEADATDEEKAIDEVNTSIYCFRRSILAPTLRRISPANAQGEYYLTDAVAVLSSAGYSVKALVLPDSMEAAGVNDRAQLAVAEAELRDRINERWMRRGVTMWDPERTYVDAQVPSRGRRLPAAGRHPAGPLHRRRRRRDRSQRRADRDGGGGGCGRARERLHPGGDRRGGTGRCLQRARARGRGGAGCGAAARHSARRRRPEG